MRNAARLGLQATCAFLLMIAHATLTAASPLPAPWINQDIGAVGVRGSSSAAGGVFTVAGAGADIWGSADAFQAAMQPVTGDVEIVARVAGIQNTNAYAKAGLMLRGSLTAGSAHVILDLRPNGSIEFMTRSANGGATTWLASTTQAPPAWLKLARVGTTVTGYVSSNGTTWVQVGTTTSTIPAAAYIGFAVTSHDATRLNSSTFDNIAVTGGTVLPAPWTTQDVGAVGVSGKATYSNGVFSLDGAGADIWGTADALRAVSQPLAGDVQLIARVTSIQNTNTYAKAGIMLRDSLAPGAAHVILDMRPNGSIEFMMRSANNGDTTWLASTTQAAPAWLKLTRSASTVTGYVSTNGTSWTQVGTATIAFGASPVGALVVTSHDTTRLNTSAFDNVSAGPLPIVIPPPGAPASPSPVSGSANLSAAPATLTWTAANATTYDVRFGTANPPPQVAAGLTAASYTTGNLAQGATYYWQVVTNNSTGSATGPVWSFSTLPAAPAVPASPSPAAGATGVDGASVMMMWTANGATSYDVLFGTTNPPALAASNIASALYAAGVDRGTTYYWQVIAKNAGGTTAGPVWSFATQVAPPAPPSLPSPVVGSTGLPVSSLALAWTAEGATSYDVLVGTTNPPAQVASNIAAAAYTLTNLQQDTTYYWQIVAKNDGGTTTGAVWSFTTDAPPISNTDNIVVYASDIPASDLHGVWQTAADSTSPNAIKLVTPVQTPNNGAALASPVDYVDVTFKANAGVPYTLWLRLQGTNNSKYSDSMYLQFSDALAGGTPVYRIGTTENLLVNLSTDSTGSSNHGWGWVNGAYWLSQPASVSFAGSGTHTLRLQVREYGVTFDQIVLSPVQFFNAAASCPAVCANAPGTLNNDATIVSKTTDLGNVGSGGGNPPPPPPPPPPPSGGSGITGTTNPSGTTTWKVAAGADLQVALNTAQPGDTIELQAGATFVGNFTLPAKAASATAYITITSAGTALPGPATRIDPSYAPLLARLRSPNSLPALATVPYAHHYQIVNLEFLANNQGFGNVIDFGDGSSAQNTLAGVPHDLIADRLYIHGDATYGQKRGIGLNSASSTVKNSYIANIMAAGQDSQAICGWNGPGPFVITNNYLEGAGENLLFGGADPAIPNLVPSDITITNNLFTKQLAWKGSQWQVKNLLELKNAQRVVINGNVFEYNWLAAQAGSSILFTPRNQDGTAPWTVVQHVEFTNNVVRHVSGVFNILGVDDIHPSLVTNDIVVRNNLFYDVNSAAFGGSGRLVLINGGQNITFDHNTVFEDGSSDVYASGSPTTGFTFTNNIIQNNAWAIMGGGASPGNGTVKMYFATAGLFQDSIIVGAPASSYPTGNYYPATMSDVGFVDYAGGNYRLSTSSSYRGAATDGKDVGANIDEINAATGTSY